MTRNWFQAGQYKQEICLRGNVESFELLPESEDRRLTNVERKVGRCRETSRAYIQERSEKKISKPGTVESKVEIENRELYHESTMPENFIDSYATTSQVTSCKLQVDGCHCPTPYH